MKGVNLSTQDVRSGVPTLEEGRERTPVTSLKTNEARRLYVGTFSEGNDTFGGQVWTRGLVNRHKILRVEDR